jgi:hypothetical protein
MTRTSRRQVVAVQIGAALAVTVFVGACGHKSPLGPPIPTGATILGGEQSVTSAPPPPPGWKRQTVVPTSLQQAQDTVLRYLKKTLQALPAGTKLDATRFSGGASTAPCEDVVTGAPPKDFSAIGDLKLPPGTDPVAIIGKTGEIWESRGWYVFERDGFNKPNRSGYSPDGYRLQIEASHPAGYPPTLIATSPCFSGDLPDDRSPFPTVLTADS